MDSVCIDVKRYVNHLGCMHECALGVFCLKGVPMGIFTRLSVAAGAAAILTLSGLGVANAATCSVLDVEHSSACIGRDAITPTPAGSASEDDLEALAGGGWTEIGKEEDGAGIAEFDIDIGETFGGDYTIFNPMVGYDYALALKGGSGQGSNFFAAYLLSAADIAANLTGTDLVGMFSMDAFTGLTGGGSGTPALSNAVLFKRQSGGGTNPTPVPLPAAGWLLIAGLGGLAAMKRRKS